MSAEKNWQFELEEYIKDGFDDSLRDYIQSEEYVSAKQQERRALAYLESLLTEDQQQAFHSWMQPQTVIVCFCQKHICMEC